MLLLCDGHTHTLGAVSGPRETVHVHASQREPDALQVSIVFTPCFSPSLLPSLPSFLKMYLVEEQPVLRALEIFKDADSTPTQLRDLLGTRVHYWLKSKGMLSQAGSIRWVGVTAGALESKRKLRSEQSGPRASRCS